MYLSKNDTLKGGKYTIIDDNRWEGSYGITYKAKDNYSDKNVAIKTPIKLDNKNNLERFEREIDALKDFSHYPNLHHNIVKYHDDFKEGQERYLVMEFLDGDTLWTLIENKNRRRSPHHRIGLSYQLAFRYIYQIGSALKAAHEKDWIHRDVHPSNIMIVKDKAVLIDFGFVRNRRLLTNQPPPGNYYFAPFEQRHGGYNPKLDIHALAACLYYALTGEDPTPSVDRLDGSDLIPPKNRSIKKEVKEAINKGTKFIPEERPASIEEWLKLLPKTRYWYWQQLIEARRLIVDWLNRFF